MTDAFDQVYERLLVVRCQAGDAGALAEIVGRYQARLSYFLRKIVGPQAVIDDLLQEVWLDVFRAITKLNDPAAFPAWIYRIARDRAYRQLREAKRLTAMDTTAEIAAPEHDEDEEFTEDEAQLVHDCLDELSQEHREVLVLRFLEALSYEGIAAIVGCGVGTVRSRLHYAKLALRKAVERRRLR
jgi:RNA polymerase sigma-70 factor (ECF subfamily)